MLKSRGVFPDGSSKGVLLRGDITRPPATNSTYTFRQSFPELAIAGSGSDSFGVITLHLSDLDFATTVTGLFDMYKFEYVEITFRPQYTATGVGSAVIVPQIKTVIDYDDNVIPTSMGQINQYESCETHMLDPFTRNFVPRHASAAVVSSTATINGLTNVKGWIDAGSTGVENYGLKYGVQGGSGSFQRWNIQIVAWLTFRCVR